ncbi:hypothetical protein QT986_27440, partial [Microcoleus sp. herbarium14]
AVDKLPAAPTPAPTGQKAAAGAAMDKLPAAPTPAPTGQKATAGAAVVELNQDWIESMRKRLKKVASQSKNVQAFEAKLRSAGLCNPPITVNHNGPVKTYGDRNGSATLTELGLKASELSALIKPTNKSL